MKTIQTTETLSPTDFDADYVEREIATEKLTFAAGTQVAELITPVAKQFVCLAPATTVSPDALSLPEGWTYSTRVLKEDFGTRGIPGKDEVCP